jgi:hypothetical protein
MENLRKNSVGQTRATRSFQPRKRGMPAGTCIAAIPAIQRRSHPGLFRYRTVLAAMGVSVPVSGASVSAD